MVMRKRFFGPITEGWRTHLKVLASGLTNKDDLMVKPTIIRAFT